MNLLSFLRKEKVLSGEEEPTDQDYKHVAEHLLLRYFQSWGQTMQERVDAISEAAKLAKVEVHFIVEDGKTIPQYPEGGNWPEFRAELNKCFPLGQFEQEATAIAGVIQRFREKARLV